MIIAGFVTKMEVFDKSTSVGTYIMTLGVIMLPIVGSTAQEQDAVELRSYLPTFLIVKNFVGQDKSHTLPCT